LHDTPSERDEQDEREEFRSDAVCFAQDEDYGIGCLFYHGAPSCNTFSGGSSRSCDGSSCGVPRGVRRVCSHSRAELLESTCLRIPCAALGDFEFERHLADGGGILPKESEMVFDDGPLRWGEALQGLCDPL
jgi:hypothetical protein